MDNHAILGAALQKYYSALKSLDEFAKSGDFFNDVSNLDKFFSEFRNITFVIQKNLKSEENKKIYEELREHFLVGDTLKWFIDTRNKTTKENPFDLKKELSIDLYLPYGIYRLQDPCLVVDVDASFNKALDYIRSVFFEKFGLVEVFFTSTIAFKEGNDTHDLYPKIKDGVNRMNQFIEEMEKFFTCNCEICLTLKEKIQKLFFEIQFKELRFTRDYTLEKGKKVIEGEQVNMFYSTPDARAVSSSELRLTLDNPIFGKHKGCLWELFLQFANMHIVIFERQEKNIMPVFMLVYGDQTYRMIPFVATTKATFYRKVQAIANLSDFAEISAVFFCGEYYAYDVEQFSQINEIPYSDRICHAKKEILTFVMMAKGMDEVNIKLDESHLGDIQYVTDQFKECKTQNVKDFSSWDWLNPIRFKLNP